MENTLNKLMAESFGVEILMSTEFSQLQAHILETVTQIA